MSDAIRKILNLRDAHRSTGIAVVQPSHAAISRAENDAILNLVPPAYMPEVSRILEGNPETAWQVHVLKECALAQRSAADIQIGEVISGFEPESPAQLELYIRIAADETTFHRVKSAIRADFQNAIHDTDLLVFPIILRKIGNV